MKFYDSERDEQVNLVQDGRIDLDVFDENSDFVTPGGDVPKWIEDVIDAAYAPSTTGLCVGSNHDWDAGAFSDIFVAFNNSEKGAVAVLLSPEYATLLAISLMKRVHPRMLAAALQAVQAQGMKMSAGPNNLDVEVIAVPNDTSGLTED